MKPWKPVLFSAFTFVLIATVTLYSSCVKDSCTELNCLNGSTCSDGFCRCPSGYEGTECERKISDKFVGRYGGNVRCDGKPSLVDTVIVFVKQEPLTLGVVRMGDANDTLVGTISGNSIMIPDEAGNNTIKYANVTVELKKLVYYREKVNNVSAGTREVCGFVGFKP